jgi:hAT family C-terminal dimerisation region
MLTFFLLQRSSSSKNIFDDLPALSAPSKSDLRDELDRYLSTDPEHVTDAIAWWYEKRLVYPRLHRMALDYLTIPGEFVFYLYIFFSLIIVI